MKLIGYGSTVVVLVIGAILLRVYGRTKLFISFVSSGIARAVPLNVLISWLLFLLAIAVAGAYILHKRQSG